jgi:hypothetical protein
MKLKCIGGPENGQVVDVASHYQENDQIQVHAKIEFDIIDFQESLQAFREGKTPNSMSVPYHYYKILVIRFSKTSRLECLVPMNWTHEDAIRFKLGC